MPKGKVPTSIDRLLTTEDVATILGISVGAARKRIERGQIPAVKMGRRNRVRESELVIYIAGLPYRDGKYIPFDEIEWVTNEPDDRPAEER